MVNKTDWEAFSVELAHKAKKNLDDKDDEITTLRQQLAESEARRGELESAAMLARDFAGMKSGDIELTPGQIRLESLQQALADDLFDAYLSDNFAVIDEVDDALRGVDTLDNLLKKLRDSWTRDGMALRTAYMKVIGAVCEDIAKRRTTPDEFDRFRREFGL